MKVLFLSVFAATAAVVFATSGASSNTDVPATSATPDSQPAGMMPSGPLFGPLTPEGVEYNPVAVPEPVWASVLAACAVSLLRRGRSY